MNSEWFIFKGTHHIGPFTSQEIEVMFKKGDITSSILIWKEGQKSWEPLSKISAFTYLFDAKEVSARPSKATPVVSEVDEVPPAIPAPTKKKLPSPIKTNLNTVDKVSRQSIVDDDELPPPIPVDAIETDEAPPVLPTKSSSGEVTKTMNFQKKFNGTKEQDYSKISLVIIGLIFAGIFVWQNILSNKADVHFKIRNIMPLYIEKLEGAATSVSTDPKFSMALSLDGKTLFVSSNRNKEIDVALKLTPVRGRVLGSDQGVIFLRGKIYDHLGEFDKVYLQDGKDFSPGEYNYELHATERHFVNTYFPAVSSIKFFRNLNKKYTVEGNELIFSSSPKEFEARLSKFKNDLFNQRTKPLQDIMERLNTANALVDQMAMILEETILHIKDGKEINKFVTVFQKDIGPVLQSLVSDKEGMGNVNDVVKATFAIYAEKTTSIAKMKKLKPETKKKLVEDFKKEIEPVRQKIEGAKNALAEEMKQLQI